MTKKQAKVQHVVAVPYPAQGHITPMLQLCQQLVPLGFTFTFVNTHHIHERVQGSVNPIENNLADGHHAHVPHQDADVHYAKHENDSSPNHAASNGPGDDAQYDNAVAPRVDGDQPMQIHSQHGLKECDTIHMVFVDGGCPPEQHAHMSTTKDPFSAAQAMKEKVEQLISGVMEEQPVAFLLTDVLLGWGNATANKSGLPWVCFWPASAATCAMLTHFADASEQGTLMPVAGKDAEGEVPVITDIPGLPPTSLNEMPKMWDDTGKIYQGAANCFSAVKNASFLLLNTFAELEGEALQALAKRCPTLAIGPLLPPRFMSEVSPDKSYTKQLGGHFSRASLFKEDRSCLDWLDTQAPSSVLFISFGSISARTEEQLEELALGVQASACPFLWVRRPDISAHSTGGPLLSAAQQQYGDGLIVPWAPQLEVLSHPAVGGFLTHCGWNSVIESVAMGVPMLCWADTKERISNQRFVVQIWKCGLNMVTDNRRYKQHIDDGMLVKRDEIRKSIRCFMRKEGGALIRSRVSQLRDFAILAYRDSSQFDHFVQAMQLKSLGEPLQ